MKKYIENWRKFLLKETRIVIVNENEEETSNLDEGGETKNPKDIKVGDRVRTSDGTNGRVAKKPHKSSGSKWLIKLDTGEMREFHNVTRLANQTKK
jgi:hypothetical protein